MEPVATAVNSRDTGHCLHCRPSYWTVLFFFNKNILVDELFLALQILIVALGVFAAAADFPLAAAGGLSGCSCGLQA